MIKNLIFSKKSKKIIFLTIILISIFIFGKLASFLSNESTEPRSVIVTLMRSNNKSIFLTINMIHSVIKFHPTNRTYQYPFLLFHDQNFTSSMRQQILSCVHKHNKHIQISFALIHFQTNVQLEPGSPVYKTMGYRLMCRFWTYDIFYHSAIVKGRYDYLMRMDDDSYFSDQLPYDLFLYMENRKLDYIYRSTYSESIAPMEPILKRFINKTTLDGGCIYNNFCIIRLKWFYESKVVQSFVREITGNDLMLRRYIGDGCAHAGMLKVDNQVKVERVTDIPYGHNCHIMPAGQPQWAFHAVNGFHHEVHNFCQTLTVLRDFRRRCIYIGIIIYLIIWLIIFRSQSSSISPNQLDIFFTSTLCGRLIRYPDLILTTNELDQLNNEASSFLSFPKNCSLFTREIKISFEELTYPLAFTILIHSNLDQFDFLLRTIYRHYNYYCIHVDLKTPQTLYQSIIDRSKCVNNIYFPKKRVNVSWGRFSVLEAEHLCQKELLKQSKQWKYYFNLANSDIPLKTNSELVQILKLYNQQNDITSLPYYSHDRQRKSLSNQTFPSSISLPFYKGEFHVLLTRTAVEYIHTNSRVVDLYHFLNGTSVPDEHYYSMINRWKETPGFYPYNHDLSQISFMTRYKIWNDRPESKLCSGDFLRGICVFNYQDLWHLATSPHLFANKILFQRDRLIPYCMAQYLDIRDSIKHEEKQYSIIDEEFYKQLKNVQYGKEKLLK